MEVRILMKYLNVEFLHSIIAIITCICVIILGPLTFSDDFGERTIFGVVSGRGNTRLQPMKTGAFTRVSHPKILDWIKNTMNSYLK